jgi:lactate 2-monooxygenase
VSFDGSAIQVGIFIAGKAEWPLEADEWEAAARSKLDPRAFDYVAGGAGRESTMRANLEAFERRRLRPRMLARPVERDLSVEVLGTRSSLPFLLAPIGVLGIVHPDADLAAARAAAAAGVPFVVSTAASRSLEAVAEAMGQAPRWFQLY